MKVLLTGGAGFVGHHIVDAILTKSDWELTVLDRAGGRFGIRRLEELGAVKNSRFKLIRHDFGASDFISLMNDHFDYEYILHFGAKTSVENSLIFPQDFIHSNIIGTQQILELAAKQKQKVNFIYVSTNEVFGPVANTSSFKEWDPYNSQSVYAATKAAGEELVLAYATQYEIPALIVHTMNLFGERQQPEKFIPSVVRSIIANKPVPVYRHGEKVGTRTYLDAQEFASALLFLMNGISNAVFNFRRDKINIAGDWALTNLALAQRIADMLDKPLHVEWQDFYDSHRGHILQTALDTGRFHELGWKSQRNFDESLRRTVKWLLKSTEWLET